MSIDNGYLYILCRLGGLYLFKMGEKTELVQRYKFEFHQNAYKLTVKNNTVLINFKLYRKIFIGEFFLIASNVNSIPPQFKLNKFYYK